MAALNLSRGSVATLLVGGIIFHFNHGNPGAYRKIHHWILALASVKKSFIPINVLLWLTF